MKFTNTIEAFKGCAHKLNEDELRQAILGLILAGVQSIGSPSRVWEWSSIFVPDQRKAWCKESEESLEAHEDELENILEKVARFVQSPDFIKCLASDIGIKPEDFPEIDDATNEVIIGGDGFSFTT